MYGLQPLISVEDGRRVKVAYRAMVSVTQAGVPQEGTRVGPQARPEYLAPMRDRHVGASRTEKGRVLTEAVTVTGYHRKAIIRAWRRPAVRPPRGPRRGRPTRYDAAVVRALRAVWVAVVLPPGEYRFTRWRSFLMSANKRKVQGS